MKTRNLQLQQIDAKISGLKHLRDLPIPPTGWLKAIRLSLGMSLEQLGRKLGIAKQNALALERREQLGAVTINSLREAAAAMDLELVYGFVPKDGTLQALIDRKAYEVAKEIIKMASQTMVLEDQGNSNQRLEKAIEERAKEIKEKMPKLLWD
jgi:predicted DNA-binding mobile mystery protein A